MKKINIVSCLSLIFVIIISSCSDMNELHDIYLQNGEITYVGRVDSIDAFPGDNRVLINYWLTDPRVKELKIKWNQKRDSIIVSVPPHAPESPLEVIIGNGNGNISEGDHTLFFYSYDDKGHRSILFETLISVYGERYKASLNNRPLDKVYLEENNLIIKWQRSLNDEEIGLEVSYFDNDNKQKKQFFSSIDLKDTVVFEDINLEKSISYKTMYLPEKSAIDTFYTDPEPIKVVISTNVALNKIVRVSDVLNSSFPGSNAVDGIISSASRWVSTPTGEHWIEIDLNQMYPVQGIKTYNGSGNAASMPIANFEFQVNVNGQWKTILDVKNNTNHSYGATFEEVITDKVRFYVPNYPDNQVRLFEIEVYSTVIYG